MKNTSKNSKCLFTEPGLKGYKICCGYKMAGLIGMMLSQEPLITVKQTIINIIFTLMRDSKKSIRSLAQA